MDTEKSTICDAEVKTLFTKGAIIVAPDKNGFTCNIFCRPKKAQGKFRLIFNLKTLNQFVLFEHFKMEGIKNLIYLIRKK